MKYRDYTIHLCLLAAFAFQLIFMIADLFTYGFLSGGYVAMSDMLIMIRFFVFVPLCIYEGITAARCKREADGDDGREHRHHRRRSIFHRKHHHHHHSHSGYIKDDSGRMDEEYSKRTQFMDKEALLKKKEEMRSRAAKN